MDDPCIDEDDVEPRFLLFGPATVVAGPAFLDTLSAVFGQLKPAAFVLGHSSIADDDGLIAEIHQLSREHDVALLAEDNVSIGWATDGMHLTDAGKVDVTRFGIGRDLPTYFATGRQVEHLFGADAGFSRHDAMVAGEGGADYVAFGEREQSAGDAVIDLIRWWQDVTVIPCLGYAADVEAVERLVSIDTDFIGIGEALWQHPESPTAAARAFSTALKKS